MNAEAEPNPETERNPAADAAVVRRMAAGDQTALAELYDRFSRPLYAVAVRILSDASEAEDVLHDAFITLWEKAGTFEASRGSAFAWAIALTRNRAIDRLRQRRRRAEILRDSAPEDFDLHTRTADPGADSRAVLGDQAVAIRTAVAALPPDQQKALELAFFSGLTQQEIAARLQEPLGTVKARIRRGLIKLRELLAHRL
jgi:RNA polymerase sigma-70 factor (ECF subfamily)